MKREEKIFDYFLMKFEEKYLDKVANIVSEAIFSYALADYNGEKLSNYKEFYKRVSKYIPSYENGLFCPISFIMRFDLDDILKDVKTKFKISASDLYRIIEEYSEGLEEWLMFIMLDLLIGVRILMNIHNSKN